MSKNNKLKQERITLDIKPLSIAKFFYQKNIKSIAVIQRLIYLTFMKVLKEKNALLFSEEWQAWSSGPVIESVFWAMLENFDKYGSDYEKLFADVPETNHKEILPYLKEIYRNYQAYKKTKDEYKLFEKTRNKPWELARRNLTEEIDCSKIETGDIISYIEKERKIEL